MPGKVVKIMGGDPVICESRIKMMADKDPVIPQGDERLRELHDYTKGQGGADEPPPNSRECF